jgi:hypothetical protein
MTEQHLTIDFTKDEVDLILYIKHGKMIEYWVNYTGNSKELYFNGLTKLFFLPKVLPIIHKWLGDESFYDKIVESTKINYSVENYWIGLIYLIETDDIFQEFQILTD